MPLFGAHLSIAGGLANAVSAAVALGCETVQIFSKNASQWKGKRPSTREIDTFRRAVSDAGLKYPTAHNSYLINLASPDDELYRKSIDAFVDELGRAEELGLTYLVAHPGAHTGSGEDVGLARITTALDEIHSRTCGFKTRTLLENTAGQGTTLGYKFEHLAALLDCVNDADRLGVCFDTCHAFAAGYPLETRQAYAATMGLFDELIGIDRLKLFHVNDSVKPLGKRVDRHAGLGLGMIGLEAFEHLVCDPRFREHPMILETPKADANGQAMDSINLGILRSLVAERPTTGGSLKR